MTEEFYPEAGTTTQATDAKDRSDRLSDRLQDKVARIGNG